MSPDPPTSRTHVLRCFCLVLGSGVGRCTLPYAARHSPSCPHGRPPRTPLECKPGSRPRGPEPALWGGEVHDAWPSAGISPSAFSTPSPFERKPSSLFRGWLLIGGVCQRCGRPHRASVHPIIGHALSHCPRSIRGGVRNVWSLAGVSAHRLRASFRV